VKVNLGCGDRYAEGGWWNVDHAGSPHRKDETVDLRGDLPWSTSSITHVYAGHVLEHLTLDACHRLLAQLLHRMVPGGQIMVVGPDLFRAQAMAEAGTLDVTMDSLRYGADRWDGDRHLWECNPEIIIALLIDAGWTGIVEVGIENVPDFWPVADRRPLWQCAVSASRPVEEPQ
jgi:hypothetical protein